ncbi:MAG: hypothetical protein DRP87_01230 [Spirochaetes bacterium]|nr:MAG: hypothetical protein DRP87_01230 [Spirochaetota bacterium]
MRKKLIVLIPIVIATVIVITACASGRGAAGKSSVPKKADIPEWYLNPPQADDAFYGVGSARMSKLDTSRKMAIARAREDIAFQMNASIKAAITDYAQEAGVDDNNQVISFVETVSRQITDTTLKGAKTEKVELSSDGTVYALVSYPMNSFLEETEKEFVRNEDAAFAEFKAQQALERLNAELENNPPKAGASSK